MHLVSVLVDWQEHKLVQISGSGVYIIIFLKWMIPGNVSLSDSTCWRIWAEWLWKVRYNSVYYPIRRHSPLSPFFVLRIPQLCSVRQRQSLVRNLNNWLLRFAHLDMEECVRSVKSDNISNCLTFMCLSILINRFSNLSHFDSSLQNGTSFLPTPINDREFFCFISLYEPK